MKALTIKAPWDERHKLLSDGEKIAWIPGYEGIYAITNFGRVFSTWRNRHGIGGQLREIKQRPSNDLGHVKVGLSHPDTGTSMKWVHRLVLETFVGPCPDGCECRHLDGVPGNNHLENLQWGTCEENHADRVKHGTVCRGESRPDAKLTAADVVSAREQYKTGTVTHQELADKYGVSRRHMTKIINRNRWTHV